MKSNTFEFKKSMRTFICVTPLLMLAVLGAASNARAQVAVRGETVYTMAGEPIKDGVVLINNGKIERVGMASQIRVPSNYRLLRARVVTPGLIDARSVVGLSGYLNQPTDQSQLEVSSAIQPELRAFDAYDARERLVEWLRRFGITTVHTGHAPGSLISGQTMIVKTVGNNVEEAVMVQTAMISASLGPAGFGQGGKPPGTRAKEMAMLRAEFLKARDYNTKQMTAKEDQKPARDLRMEALARVLRGEIPLLIAANRAQDIITALRLAKEFNIKIVLDGAAEAYLVLDQLRAANVPVLVHPTMQRPSGESENLSMETAATLRRAGIPVALQSGYETYVPKVRVVLFEAAIAAANGLSFTDALAAITIDAARILGISNRVGSLEAGKDADLALFDGDPFEYTTHVTTVIVNGKVVSEEAQ